ncbi:hypothetical protein AB0M46_38455 [Dactylosporangium sp. NPDC051485]|uniref:hypothetical protein n=1 Tax=Dactylosporangium sp. NPDC051485 TaxID=3154846 RepID=UPI003415B9FB
MTYPPQNPDDEPRSEPFRPVSYDLAPEFGTPPPVNNPGPYGPPPATQPAPGYPVSGQPGGGYPAAGQRGAGYPAAAQPGVGYPTSAPPSGYPVSAQPGYPVSAQPASPAMGQPGYPPPQPTFAPPPPPAKKGKGLKITLAVVGAVLLVCAVVACVYFYPFIKEGNAHVAAPPTLPGDLTKETGDSATTLSDSAESSLRSDVKGLEEVATGVYTAGGNTDQLVVVVAATGTFLSPGSEVDNAFKGFGNSASKTSVGTATSYPAGELGGTVKCADGKASTEAGAKFALCAWADHGSIGMVVFFGRSAADAAPLFVQIREAVQTRS